MKRYNRFNESNRVKRIQQPSIYRRQPMSLPKTGSNNENGYRDWNDESVYSEEPFGTRIGSSAPFDKVVNEAVDYALKNLKKKL